MRRAGVSLFTVLFCLFLFEASAQTPQQEPPLTLDFKYDNGRLDITEQRKGDELMISIPDNAPRSTANPKHLTRRT